MTNGVLGRLYYGLLPKAAHPWAAKTFVVGGWNKREAWSDKKRKHEGVSEE